MYYWLFLFVLQRYTFFFTFYNIILLKSLNFPSAFSPDPSLEPGYDVSQHANAHAMTPSDSMRSKRG